MKRWSGLVLVFVFVAAVGLGLLWLLSQTSLSMYAACDEHLAAARSVHDSLRATMTPECAYAIRGGRYDMQ